MPRAKAGGAGAGGGGGGGGGPRARVSVARVAQTGGVGPTTRMKLRPRDGQGDTCMVMVHQDVTFDEVVQKVAAKLGERNVRIYCKDDDDELMAMHDDDDYHMGRTLAPDTGRIELWY